MKAATRRLFEEQIVVVAVLGSGKKSDAMWHVPQCKLSTTCSNLLMYPNEELPVAVDHNHIRTMASEITDRIDWSHPHPHGQ